MNDVVLSSWWTVAVGQINLLTWTTLSHYESLAVGMPALRPQLYSSWVCHLCTLTLASGWHQSLLYRSFQQLCPRTCLVLWVLAMFKDLPSLGMSSRLVLHSAFYEFFVLCAVVCLVCWIVHFVNITWLKINLWTFNCFIFWTIFIQLLVYLAFFIVIIWFLVLYF